MIRILTVLLLMCPTLTAQVPPGPRGLLVATAAPGPSTTTLFAVDALTGATTAVGQVPVAPLAVMIDPVNLDILLASDDGAGTSGVWRIALSGPVIASTRRIATVAGRITDLAAGGDGLVFASVRDGFPDRIWAIPRNGRGGVPFTVLYADRPVSLFHSAPGSSTFGVLASGTQSPPGAPPAHLFADVGVGLTGQVPLVGTSPPEVDSGLELPTAVPRYLLTHPDGTVTLWENGAGSTLPLVPPLGPGGARALVLDTLNLFPYVLGGQATPYLFTFDVFNPTQFSVVAGPFPGDPVDVAIAPPAGPAVIPAAASCGLSAFSFSSPSLGNGSFALGVSNAIPGAPVHLALGLSDQTALGSVPLPATLPGGCAWWVDPALVIEAVAGGTGAATIPLPVPADPALAGAVLFTQWIQFGGSGTYATSEPYALHVGL